MSNDMPPRACLADFGFMTMVRDDPMSDSAQLEGGTLMFMSPELLAPQNFGMKHSIPTPQSDIYAFGLVIFQVRGNNDGHKTVHLTLFRFLQVKSHSPVVDRWDFSSLCWPGCAQPNQITPQPLGFLTYSGNSFNVVGMPT